MNVHNMLDTIIQQNIKLVKLLNDGINNGDGNEELAQKIQDNIEAIKNIDDTLNNFKYDVQEIISGNNNEVLQDTISKLNELGDNYKSLYNLAQTFKTFLESTDTSDTTINRWKEIESFLNGITDTETLTGLLENLENNIKNDSVVLQPINIVWAINNTYTITYKGKTLDIDTFNTILHNGEYENNKYLTIVKYNKMTETGGHTSAVVPICDNWNHELYFNINNASEQVKCTLKVQGDSLVFTKTNQIWNGQNIIEATIPLNRLDNGVQSKLALIGNVINNIDQLDRATKTGLYICNNHILTNKDDTAILAVLGNTPNYIIQTLYDGDSIKSRHCDNGVWSEWKIDDSMKYTTATNEEVESILNTL